MRHTQVEAASNESAAAEPVSDGSEPVVLQIADRTAPRWVDALASLFQSASSILILAVPVLCSSLIALPNVADSGLAAALIGLVGFLLVAGTLALDLAQNMALRGYRNQREAAGAKARFWLGLLVALVLCAVHPLLALGPATAMAGSFLLQRYWQKHPNEPLWEANKQEAAAFLSGRDAVGFSMAIQIPTSHALRASAIHAASWLALVLTFAIGSGLRANAILSAESVIAVGLLSYWSAYSACSHILRKREAGRASFQDPPQITERADVSRGAEELGLNVRGLNVATKDGRTLLSDLNLQIERGVAVGVIGPSGSGKSLLLQTLQDPFSLDGLIVTGSAKLNRHALWHRTDQPGLPPSVLLPQEPILLPMSGLDNLTCCDPKEHGERAKRVLERLVFSTDTAQSICETPDARLLPGRQRKLLAFARAFYMSPELYLFDRPEDSLEDHSIGALCVQITQERRLGRSLLMVTDKRALLDLCDQLIVMQDGRIVDWGPSQLVRDRMTSGWTRLVVDRRLESEDNLRRWIRNLFKRPHDSMNRKAVTAVACELLAFSCQTALPANKEQLIFEFKHMKGHVILRLLDNDETPSSGTMTRARAEVESGAALSPLASILKGSKSFECTEENGHRNIALTIETDDGRNAEAAASNAEQVQADLL